MRDENGLTVPPTRVRLGGRRPRRGLLGAGIAAAVLVGLGGVLVLVASQQGGDGHLDAGAAPQQRAALIQTHNTFTAARGQVAAEETACLATAQGAQDSLPCHRFLTWYAVHQQAWAEYLTVLAHPVGDPRFDAWRKSRLTAERQYKHALDELVAASAARDDRRWSAAIKRLRRAHQLSIQADEKLLEADAHE